MAFPFFLTLFFLKVIHTYLWITPCKRRTTSLAFFNHPQLIHKYVDKLDNFVNNPICWEKSSRVIHISSTSPNLFYFQSITVNLISEPTFIFPNNFLYFSHFLQNTSVFYRKEANSRLRSVRLFVASCRYGRPDIISVFVWPFPPVVYSQGIVLTDAPWPS